MFFLKNNLNKCPFSYVSPEKKKKHVICILSEIEGEILTASDC